jgi:Flp pilus assembly protein CpaB
MLATSCRRVNGRLRQKTFGVADMVIARDLAPRNKKDAKIKKVYEKKDTRPVLYAPLDLGSGQQLISNSRIKQNQQIEAQIVAVDLAKESKHLEDLTHRDGGPLETASPSRLVETRRAGSDVLPGDYVALFG